MVELLSIRWERARNKFLHERQAEGLLDSQTLTTVGTGCCWPYQFTRPHP